MPNYFCHNFVKFPLTACENSVLTDNEPGDDQLSTAAEARGSSQTVDYSVGIVPAGCRAEEP